MRRARFFLLAPFILLAVLAFIALGGVVVQSLWNWLLPSLFGLPVVTFWQALGLLALSRILFGGVGSRSRGPRWRRRPPHWLTPDERSGLRARMHARFGGREGTA